MKRFFYIPLAIIAALVCSCEEEIAETPVYKDAGMLEVSFQYKAATAKSIVLTPALQTIEVEAKLNMEDVKWNVVSDQPWCEVDEDIIHEGSGTFHITVKENTGYADREAAIVSLCAGEYKADLRVTQMGNIFILEQIFGLGMKSSGSTEISLKMQEGTDMETRSDSDWLTVECDEISRANGEVEYKMTVSWDENTSVSRLGAVELYRTGDDLPAAKYALWQFGEGQEYDFEADGKIRIASQPSAEIPLEIKTPTNHIEELKHPEWVQLEKVVNEDNTTSWFLYFESNPSDHYSYRETQLAYTTLNASNEKVLPTIYQDSYHVGGLMTAKGFALFAEKFNAGGADAVSDWVKDGVVNVLTAVDMSAFEGKWNPIGTEEYPFNLKFNGNEKSISNFTASSPLFGICNGAEIYNVILDETCSVNMTSDINAHLYLAAIAGQLNESKMRDCSSAASVKLDARSVLASAAVYAGGLVGHVGANSTISGCTHGGKLDVAVTRTSSNGYAYVGGIAGYVAGAIETSVNTGSVSDNTASKFHYVGGITGFVYEGDAALKTCENSGEVKHTSTRTVDSISEMNRDVYVGGVTGGSRGVLTDLKNSGSVEIWTNAKTIYLGGVVGCVLAGSAEKCVADHGAVSYNRPLDLEDTPANLGKYVYMGGVFGSLNIPMELDYAQLPVTCDVKATSVEPNSAQLLVGGIIGYAQAALTIKSPQWSGSIDFTMSKGNNVTGLIGFGGILGSTLDPETVVTGAQTSGKIMINAISSSIWVVPTSAGGIVGCARGGVTISESTNNAVLDWTGGCAKSNDRGVVSMGGIVGTIEKGVSNISKCTNNGSVTNLHYHNNKWETGKLMGTRTAGIVGTYGYVKTKDTYVMDTGALESSKITISDCHSTADIVGYRGLVGGIAGYLYNAEVKGCTNTGSSSSKRHNCNVGGIAGAVEKTSIDNCTVTASLYGRHQGSCGFKAGGIAAYLYTDSSISNSRYFGHITTGDNGTAEVYYGGIVGETQTGCSVNSCSFGGSILNETITSENFADYAIGNKAIEAVGCTYWSGE